MSQFEITLRIDREAIERAAIKAISDAFQSPGYGTHAGLGYKAVEDAVRDFIEGFDFGPIIQRLAQEKVSSVVDQVLRPIMKKRASHLAEEMKANGTLFAGKED